MHKGGVGRVNMIREDWVLSLGTILQLNLSAKAQGV